MAEDQVPGSGCSELSSRPAVKERDYGKNIFSGCSSVHLKSLYGRDVVYTRL